jgi:tetrahydromethanopterin S-methyltransferase subunit F
MLNIADTIRCGLALGILFFGVFMIINLLIYFY